MGVAFTVELCSRMHLADQTKCDYAYAVYGACCFVGIGRWWVVGVGWCATTVTSVWLIRPWKIVARHFVVRICVPAVLVFDSWPFGCSQIARLIKFQWGARRYLWAAYDVCVCVLRFTAPHTSRRRFVLAARDALPTFRRQQWPATPTPMRDMPLLEGAKKLSQLFECLLR